MLQVLEIKEDRSIAVEEGEQNRGLEPGGHHLLMLSFGYSRND